VRAAHPLSIPITVCRRSAGSISQTGHWGAHPVRASRPTPCPARLEARLADQLDQPQQRLDGEYRTRARRHARDQNFFMGIMRGALSTTTAN
jgi:hypothetical protein